MKQQAFHSDDFYELELKKGKRLEGKLDFETECHKDDIGDCNKHLYSYHERLETDHEDRVQERKERNTMLKLLLKIV